MIASKIGEHLLIQGVGTWDPHELGHCEASSRLYDLAQLLRSPELAGREVPVDGDRVTFPELAAALAMLESPALLHNVHRAVLARGLDELCRPPEGGECTSLDLQRVYTNPVFPPPL